jgi:hypothetical protein
MATIRQDRILDTWMRIVLNGGGQGERVYRMTEEYLDEAKFPGLVHRREDVNSGFMTRGRDFLVVRNTILNEYIMFLSARDVGTHLDCSWYLTCRPGLFRKAVAKYAGGGINLSVFAQQDLSAWTSIVHNAFLRSVKEIMEELKQDITGMQTRSKGYLSVW